MLTETEFSEIGFDNEIKQMFEDLTHYIESEEGCKAKVYKTHAMKQARAANFAPGDGQVKARQLFAMILPRRKGFFIYTRKRFTTNERPLESGIFVTRNFTDWQTLKATLREWSSLAKDTKKPKPELDFGDGVALSGGRPESNRRKF